MTQDINLDIQLAQQVLGAVVLLDNENLPRVWDLDAGQFVPVPPYSSDFAAIWSLVIRYREQGCSFELQERGGKSHFTIFHHTLGSQTASGSTLPLAVARALLAFGPPEPETLDK